MKKKTPNQSARQRKLVLKPEVIATLTGPQLGAVVGGIESWSNPICTSTPWGTAAC